MRAPKPRITKPNLHPVVQALRQARYDQGLTALMLAQKIGYSETSIFKWEIGEINPRLQYVHDWAQALGMELKVEKSAPYAKTS